MTLSTIKLTCGGSSICQIVAEGSSLSTNSDSEMIWETLDDYINSRHLLITSTTLIAQKQSNHHSINILSFPNKFCRTTESIEFT